MITSISFRNFKGTTGKLNLTGREMLTGPNGSSKSTVLEGLKIALTAYTDLGKKPGKLLEYCSGDVLEVTIGDEKGNFLTRKIEKAGPGGKLTTILNGEVIKDGSTIPPTLRFPTEAVHPAEFTALSGEGRAAWLFEAMGGAVDVLKPEDITGKWDWFANPMAAGEVIDKLTEAHKNSTSELKKCQANLQRLTGEQIALPVGNQREWEDKLAKSDIDLEAATKELSAEEERGKLGESRHALRLNLEEQLRKADAKIQTTEEEIGRLSPVALATEPEGPSLKTLEDQIASKYQAVAVLGASSRKLRAQAELIEKQCKCPTCGMDATSLESVLADWDRQATGEEAQIEDIQDDISCLKADIETATKSSKRKAEIQQARIDLPVLKDALKSYRKSVEDLENNLAKTNDVGGNAAIDPAVIKAKVDGLKAYQLECRESLKKHHQSTAIKAERAKAQDELTRLTALLETIKKAGISARDKRNKALEQVTLKLAAPFEKAVKIGFNKEPYFRILDAKGKPEVDFGIVKNGREIGFDTLSGGERTVILVALIAAIQIAKGTEKPRLALVEMAEADADRTRSVFESCDAIGFEQVVLASCNFNAPAPEGWTDVDMSGFGKEAQP